MRSASRAWAVRAVLAATVLALGRGAARAGEAEPVVLEVPAPGQVVGRSFEVRGTVDPREAEGASLRVGGAEVAVVDGRFQTTVTAPADGPFSIRVLLGKPGLPAFVTQRAVEVDATPPSIEVTTPAEETGVFPSGEATVSAVVRDAHLSTVTCNGADVPPDEQGRVRATFLLPAEGELAVTIEARDALGNSASVRRVLRRGPPPAAGPPTPAAARPPPDAVAILVLADRSATDGGDDAWLAVLAAIPQAVAAMRRYDLVSLASFAEDARMEVAPVAIATDPVWKEKEGARSRSRAGLAKGLALASEALAPETAATRHVVLVFGGEPGPGDGLQALGAAQSLRRAGIGVSVVAHGAAGKAQSLFLFAQAGGGRYYATADAAELARILKGEISAVRQGRPRDPAPATTLAGKALAPFTLRGTNPVQGFGPKGRAAIDFGLRWLAAHQTPLGRWEAQTFPQWCDGKPYAEGRPSVWGVPEYDVGVTALALLAFLGAGYSGSGTHAYDRVVESGLWALVNAQEGDGCFGPRATGHFVYNHAAATLAMVEAYGMTRRVEWRVSAQRGLDFVAACRNPGGAWRYGVKPGDDDTSVTGWMVAACATALIVNDAEAPLPDARLFRVDSAAVDGARAWIEAMTDPASGRVGYQTRGSGVARLTSLAAKFPAEKSEALTALSIHVRLLLGQDPAASPVLRQGANLLSPDDVHWDPNGGNDVCYWYYATHVTWRLGGERWNAWRQRMRIALVDEQRMDETPCTFRGSWDPVDPWGDSGGRVYETALAVRTLEVPTLLAPVERRPR